MNNASMTSQILAIWLVLNLILITVWDLVIIFLMPDAVTVSRFLWEWGHRYPLLYFALGLAVGHIMLPLLVTLQNGRNT